MYTPPSTILKKYAAVLVTYALGGGEGVKPGEVVQVVVPECAKPMYAPLRDAVIDAGANPIMMFLPDNVDLAGAISRQSDEQLNFFAEHYFKGLIDQVDHSLMILAEADKYELAKVAPEKLLQRQKAMKPYRVWREEKERMGKFTWTLALYGTPAMAKEVGMTEKEYWEQIRVACFLDDPDPIATWKKVAKELERTRLALNALDIASVHITGADADLKISLGTHRQWLGGSGRNIPSFELFTSPDWRETQGWIRFNQPLYTHGQRVEGIELHFEKGLITKATATYNEALLKEMIATEGANRLGEFSLTDGRLSRITKVMGETLYDENMGGPEGNTHVAIGNAYKEAFTGDVAATTHEQWQEMGYNESVVHTDIISTERRTVTATLRDGSTKVIYDQGKFLV